MSLCNIIKLENRMYKLILQSAMQAGAGTDGGGIRWDGRTDGWMQPARRTGSPR